MGIEDSKIVFAAYVPVIHRGYIEAFDRHPEALIVVLDDSVTKLENYLRKDIRRLSPRTVAACISALGRDVFVAGIKDLESIFESKHVIMPDDDLTKVIMTKYPRAKIEREPIFLRWDRDNSTTNTNVVPDRTVSLPINDPIIAELASQKNFSANWWRHVGAVCADPQNTILISKHNASLPTQYSSWIDSDPRITTNRGDSIERSIDIHAEAWIIAEAAKKGMSLRGTNFYVSTFPCPNCAKLIAMSGAKACYFIEGYAMVDGYDVLNSAGVEIIKIDVPDLPAEDQRTLVPYPKN